MTKWTWSSTIIIILNHLDLAFKDPYFTFTRSSRDISFRAISKSIHLWHQKWGCPSKCIMDRLKPRSPSCWTVPTVCPGLNRGPLYIFKFQVQVHFILYPEVDFDCSIVIIIHTHGKKTWRNISNIIQLRTVEQNGKGASFQLGIVTNFDILQKAQSGTTSMHCIKQAFPPWNQIK